jgi:hypothetical protein
MIDLGQRMHEVKALGRLHANSGDMLAAAWRCVARGAAA